MINILDYYIDSRLELPYMIYSMINWDDNRIIVSSYKKINIWNTEDKLWEFNFSVNNSIGCMSLLSKDELITGSHNGTVGVYNLITQQFKIISEKHFNSIVSLDVLHNKVLIRFG